MAASSEPRRGPHSMAFSHPHDLIVSGLDRIEIIGNGLARFVLYVDAPEMPKRRLLRLPLRLSADRNFVMPLAAIPDAIGKTLFALSRTVIVGRNGLTIEH